MSRLSFVAAVLLTLSATPVFAQTTVGNPATPASQVDGCSTCTFVINQGFGAAGLKVGTYNFFANTTADITPLLLDRTDAGTSATFTIIGIGQLRNASLGVNSYSFDTVQGTNVTTANSFFGFGYTHGGVVAFDYTNVTPSSGTFVAPANFPVTLGGTFSADFSSQPNNSYSALDARTYSINATGAVPEPATWAMMLVGFGMVGFGLRRRSKQAARVTYA